MFEQQRLGDLLWKFPHPRDAIFPERVEGAIDTGRLQPRFSCNFLSGRDSADIYEVDQRSQSRVARDSERARRALGQHLGKAGPRRRAALQIPLGFASLRDRRATRSRERGDA